MTMSSFFFFLASKPSFLFWPRTFTLLKQSLSFEETLRRFVKEHISQELKRCLSQKFYLVLHKSEHASTTGVPSACPVHLKTNLKIVRGWVIFSPTNNEGSFLLQYLWFLLLTCGGGFKVARLGWLPSLGRRVEVVVFLIVGQESVQECSSRISGSVETRPNWAI